MSSAFPNTTFPCCISMWSARDCRWCFWGNERAVLPGQTYACTIPDCTLCAAKSVIHFTQHLPGRKPGMATALPSHCSSLLWWVCTCSTANWLFLNMKPLCCRNRGNTVVVPRHKTCRIGLVNLLNTIKCLYINCAQPIHNQTG